MYIATRALVVTVDPDPVLCDAARCRREGAVFAVEFIRTSRGHVRPIRDRREARATRFHPPFACEKRSMGKEGRSRKRRTEKISKKRPPTAIKSTSAKRKGWPQTRDRIARRGKSPEQRRAPSQKTEERQRVVTVHGA